MKIFFCFLFFYLNIASAEDCKIHQRKSTTLKNTNGAIVAVDFCENGIILVTFNKKNSPVRRKKLSVDGAYNIYFINSIDFNVDGIMDLGISNGKGRSGDGYYYWLIKNNPFKAQPLGDFPLLKPVTGEKTIFYSTSSGNGEVIGVRTDFSFKEENLVKHRSFFYEPNDTDGFDIYEEYYGDKNTQNAKLVSPKADEPFVDNCMRGGKCK